EALENAVRQLVADQRQLVAHYLTRSIGETPDVPPEPVRQQATQVLAHLGGLLDGAEVDSYEIAEARHAWRGLIHQLLQLSSTLEHLRQTSRKNLTPDLLILIPGLQNPAAELDRRFSEIGRMLEGHLPEHGPTSVPLNVDERS